MKTKFITLLIALGIIFSQKMNAINVTVGTSGDYPSIAAAIAGVGSISEPLIIELKSDYVMTSDSILTVSGASATNTVTIRPQATLTVAGNGAYVWKMKGCQYVTIDGRIGGTGTDIALTLRADTLVGNSITTALKKTIALKFENDASYNTVQYVNLRGATTLGFWRVGTTSAVDRGTITFGAGIATGNSNNTIDHCDLGPIHPYTGAPSTAIYSSGTAGFPNINITISNNKIYDYFSTDLNKASGAGIQVGSGVGVLLGANTSNCTISGNSFYQTTQRTQYGNANGAKTGAIIIDNNTTGSGFIVKDNYIGGSEPLCAGTNRYYNAIGNATGFNGIYLSTVNTASSYVYGNTIKNIYILAHSPIAQNYKSAGIGINGGNVYVGVKEDGTTSSANIIGDISASAVGTTNAAIIFSGSNNNAAFAGITFNSIAGANVRIANNKIAGICIATNATARTSSFIGIDIFNKATNTSTLTINNNEIGNNGIGIDPASMSIQNYQGRNCFGIYANEAGDVSSVVSITNNKINNMYKAPAGNATLNAQTYVNGIWINTAILYPITISDNIIRDLVFTNGRVNDTPINWASGITYGAQGAGSVIRNNTIYNIEGVSSASVNAAGICLLSTVSTATNALSNNKIYNISSNITRKIGQYAAGSTGILTYATGAIAPTFNVYNNMISLGKDRAGNDVTSFAGLIGVRDSVLTTAAATVNYYNNSISISGSNVAASDTIRSFGINFATGAATSAVRTAKNNLIINARSNTSGGANHYAIGTVAASTSSFTSDYNNLYSSGTGGNIGYITGAAQNTLANWKTASSKDANSISKNVIFTGGGDLSLSGNSALDVSLAVNEIGTPVTTDYFGNARHTPKVYVGAHEPSDINQSKTFTVTAPSGTERVYIVGSFTGKSWDIVDPLELTTTATPYEFSGTFLAANDVTYKYLCQKGSWEYQEATSVAPLTEASNHTYSANDVVAYWKAMPKIKMNVSIASGGTPSALYVKGGWNGWSTPVALTASSTPLSAPSKIKSATNAVSYTGVIGNGTTDVIYANTEYKYYTTDLVDPNWEVNADGSAKGNRWSIYPLMGDEIARFATQIATGAEDARNKNIVLMRTSSGISATFDGEASIELYNINGSLIEKTKANGSYSRNLQNGAYLIRINDKVTKFVK